MVDPVDFPLGKDAANLVIQLLGARQVMPERLFDDEPLKAVRFRQSFRLQAGSNGAEKFRRHRQIKDAVAFGLVCAVELFEERL